ncbi:GNAT family N-acetyltransferase [Rhodospirillum sp. A1_3_36]|uniref:GNAT family N-acetyltransferase n=1 Tax=Rhodospirillum sp. A1_3_36 TaxID=3391666 RepID=UPI0039A6DD7C
MTGKDQTLAELFDRSLAAALAKRDLTAGETPPSEEEGRALFLAGRGRDLLAAPLPPEALAYLVEGQRRVADRALQMTYPDAECRWIRRAAVEGESQAESSQLSPVQAMLVVAQGRDRRELRLVDLVVLPEAQGQGLGRALVEAVLVLADSLGVEARLDVHPGNEKARRLYEGLGFQANLGTQGDREMISIPMVRPHGPPQA